MNKLIAGITKFQRDAFPKRSELFRRLATEQHPSILFITCSDSRVEPSLLMQQEPGELFVIRNAGNIVPSYGPEPGGVSASVEYAVVELGVSDVIICGHSDCGAMTAIADCKCMDHMPAVANWLRHAAAAKAVNAARDHASDHDRLNSLVRENVIAQLANIRTHPAVALALEQRKLNLHGWVYDIESGAIAVFEESRRRFVSLAERYGAAANNASANDAANDDPANYEASIPAAASAHSGSVP